MFIAVLSLVVVLVTQTSNADDRRAEPEPVRAQGNPLRGLKRQTGGGENEARHDGPPTREGAA
jgi:hypothetical protein